MKRFNFIANLYLKHTVLIKLFLTGIRCLFEDSSFALMTPILLLVVVLGIVDGSCRCGSLPLIYQLCGVQGQMRAGRQDRKYTRDYLMCRQIMVDFRSRYFLFGKEIYMILFTV